MRKITFKITLMLGFLSILLLQAQTVYQFDLNYNSGAIYQTAGNWNAVNGTTTAVSLPNFIDSNGVASTYTMAITAPFVAANDSGTQNPSPTIGFPGTATRDAFYVQNGATSSATFTFSGLNVNNYYSFTIFACRDGVTDNRESLYTIAGITTGTATLNPSSNTTNVATVNNIKPAVDGTITITITKGANNVNGSGYAYINAFKITETTEMLAVQDVNIKNQIQIFPNPITDVFYLNLSKNYKNVNLEIYTLDGKKVKSLQFNNGLSGKVRIDGANLKTGTYMFQVKADGEKFSQKVIVK